METLPLEIITKVLEYLPFGDRRVVALVNKTFYQAADHPTFSRKELFTYRTMGVDLKKFTDFKNMLMNSKRKLFCLKFVDFTFMDDLTIFTNSDNRIISLHFNNVKCLNESFLDAISQCCGNLEELEFVQLRDFSITAKNRAPLYKLCSITLDEVQISDTEFNSIFKLAPNLKDLSIVNCNSVSFLQNILTNVPNVKHLYIVRCHVINDSNFVDLAISNLKELITLKILGSSVTHLSLRHITNSTLRVLTVDGMSILPFETEDDMLLLEHSISVLGSNIPLLTELELFLDPPSFGFVARINLLSLFENQFTSKLKKYFKCMKIFRFWE